MRSILSQKLTAARATPVAGCCLSAALILWAGIVPGAHAAKAVPPGQAKAPIVIDGQGAKHSVAR